MSLYGFELVHEEWWWYNLISLRPVETCLFVSSLLSLRWSWVFFCEIYGAQDSVSHSGTVRRDIMPSNVSWNTFGMDCSNSLDKGMDTWYDRPSTVARLSLDYDQKKKVSWLWSKKERRVKARWYEVGRMAGSLQSWQKIRPLILKSLPGQAGGTFVPSRIVLHWAVFGSSPHELIKRAFYNAFNVSFVSIQIPLRMPPLREFNCAFVPY